MSVTDSRQRNGTLTLDGIDYATQSKNVRILPPEQPDDAAEEVLSGDPLAGEEAEVWKLAITAVQDFSDPDGFVNMTWVSQGVKVPFVWRPQGAGGPSYAGVVTVWPVLVGGDMNKRLEADAEWKCDDKPSRTEAA